MILNAWINDTLSGDVEESQQHYVEQMGTSQETWNELRRIHGVSGKGKLAPMMQTYHSYAKGAGETIDQMSATIRRMCDDIENLAPGMRPADISIATVMMNACQGKEYAMAKHTLNNLEWEDLTPGRVVEQLRGVEQDIRKDAAHVASTRGKRAGKPGLSRGCSGGVDKSNVECYGCGKKGHYKSECPSKKDERELQTTRRRRGYTDRR